MKKSMKISLVTFAALVAAGTALFLLSRMFGGDSVQIYYTRIDNSKIKENHSSGGVIDLTGGLAYSYTLPAYDENGKEREIEFGMSRKLTQDAFIRLEVLPVRGVVNWSEARYDELPAAVRACYPEPTGAQAAHHFGGAAEGRAEIAVCRPERISGAGS